MDTQRLYDMGLCITDGVPNDSPAKQEKRFCLFEQLGIRTARVSLPWCEVEPKKGVTAHPQMLSQLKCAVKHGLRLKLIGGTIMDPPQWFFTEHPNAYMVNQDGKHSCHNTISYWLPHLAEYTAEALERTFLLLKKENLLDAVDALVVDMGAAGEPLYPAGWTQEENGLDADGTIDMMWCYSADAQEDFRRVMQRKYTSIDQANEVWGTTLSDFSVLLVPKPDGSVKGPLWRDTLYWYRDTKRQFEEMQLLQYQKLVEQYSSNRISLILYLPGWDIRDEEYEKAIADGTACSMIRLMADNQFILQLAQKYGCLLQHTGVNDSWEAAHIRECCDRMGMSKTPIFGENAGDYNNAKNPIRLVEFIQEYGYNGIDYTHSRHIFQEDGMTPSPLYVPFSNAITELRAYLKNKYSLS